VQVTEAQARRRHLQSAGWVRATTRPEAFIVTKCSHIWAKLRRGSLQVKTPPFRQVQADCTAAVASGVAAVDWLRRGQAMIRHLLGVRPLDDGPILNAGSPIRLWSR
jgi:hypothetical protein